MAKDQPVPFELPADLTSLDSAELERLATSAQGEFETLYADGPKAENLDRAKALVEGKKALTAETTRRSELEAATRAQFEELGAQMNPTADASTEGDSTPPADGGTEPPAAPSPAPAAPAAAPVPVTASSTSAIPRELGGLRGGPSLNPSLAAARGNATAVTSAPAAAPYEIYASTVLPGTLTAGARIDNFAQLGELVQHAARNLAVTSSPRNRKQTDPYGGVSVARVRHSYEDVFAPNASETAVAAYQDKIRRMMRPDQMEALVASGGWCAPSENRYSFFNIACAGGQLDLPTFGVQRGGLRWPISPSLADAFTPDLAPFEAAPSVGTVPWVWTEISDVQAATGTLVKPCIKVPCSTFDEARLECYGVCVTAGNLADNAWPESTANFLRLLDVAFQHTMNYRYIQTIRNLTSDVGTISCTGVGAASPLLDAIELAATDYRRRLVMCEDDVLEVVLPQWIFAVLRADVARRTGVDMLGVTDDMIQSWFNARHVRVQLVDDYQVRASGQPGYSTAQTSWPTTVEFMIWAPGTFALGNGMVLDLGVVRDSTLNETNDHTAAWYEQCHMIAKFGHLARRYTVNLCASGVTGAANITACCV